MPTMKIDFYRKQVFGCVLAAGLALASQDSQAQVRIVNEPCTEDLSKPLTPELRQARNIFQALTGVGLPFCDKRIQGMAIHLKNDRPREAAKVATGDALFYDLKIRDLAMKWCHLNESVRNEINDCVAMVVGSIRDGSDIREMLAGNYHYQVNTAKLRLSNITDYPGFGLTVQESITTNNHFRQITERGLSMFHILRRENYQIIGRATRFNDDGIADQATPQVNSDPGGLLTSRGFLTAHAVAGTNRRLVEYAFKQFMCTPIQDLADNSLSDQYVGPDVERAPAGDSSKYLISCKSCHAPMDSMRPAFAFVDTNPNGTFSVFTPGGVRDNKFRRSGVGYTPKSSRFENLATAGSNAAKFGWRGPASGEGIKDFAKMIADSKMFSTCMVKQAFKSVCGSEPEAKDMPMIETLTKDLEGDDTTKVRDIRAVFERLALRPDCVGR